MEREGLKRVGNAKDRPFDPRHLTAFDSTGAEAISPVRNWAIVGTLEVERERIGAFTAEDQAFLEACAHAITPLWSDR